MPRAWGSPCWPSGCTGKPPGPDRPEGFADVNFWIDTRDTRNVSRATRFCHRFAAILTLSRDRKGLDVEVNQRADRPGRGRRPDVRPPRTLLPGPS